MKLELTYKEYIDGLALAHTDEYDFRPIADSLDRIAEHVHDLLSNILNADLCVSAQYNGNAMSFTMFDTPFSVGIIWINEIDVDVFLSKTGLKVNYYEDIENYPIEILQSLLIAHIDAFISKLLVGLWGYSKLTDGKYDKYADDIIKTFKKISEAPIFILDNEQTDENTFIIKLKEAYKNKNR